MSHVPCAKNDGTSFTKKAPLNINPLPNESDFLRDMAFINSIDQVSHCGMVCSSTVINSAPRENRYKREDHRKILKEQEVFFACRRRELVAVDAFIVFLMLMLPVNSKLPCRKDGRAEYARECKCHTSSHTVKKFK